MIITEKHYRAIEYLVEGRSITDIAKLIGVERKTIYNWMDKGEFKAELHKRKQGIKAEAEERLDSRLNLYIVELHDIAMNSKSDKVKHDSLCYLIDRILGKPTKRISNVDEDNDELNSKILDIEEIIKSLDVKEENENEVDIELA